MSVCYVSRGAMDLFIYFLSRLAAISLCVLF